ncbi:MULTISPECIES: UDP-N-acetylglucosamine 1-carboxyvinyltransferase [Jonquetella]|uniref:UDP-N-acetylglucosamine 1-carboxyvinyltransferase n=1 Tax=Jonquetella anthropi DSM 22815 TaxID=885272 RepID=H0UK69_9BACT|nr:MULTISPECIES: UDP-N-acetylglucosamine 1-carboxyvinyltransferase [Jonquetella]EHM13078.1 UDP-N-acetylglucosamine 1-carboxyvinyltransferase [Jonquetella anthropi DSM 22815]
MAPKRVLKVTGGVPLNGTVAVQGAKNAALPVLASAILLGGGQTLTVHNVPRLMDTETLVTLLQSMGLSVTFSDGTVVAKRCGDLGQELPVTLVQKMRASSLVLGPLLAREGRAVMPLPGGCAIGTRPMDLHLKGLAKMGASVELRHGAVHAESKCLRGGRIYLDFPSVGATENLLMAATLAQGETIIENAAREPEIVNLAASLQAMGAKITGVGTGIIHIHGCSELHSGEVTIIPDRIAAGTYLLAGVITDGHVTVDNVVPQHFDSLLAKLEEAHVSYERAETKVTVFPSRKSFRSVSVSTLPYPGFPTDIQPQMVAALSLASGTSIVKESIFESRFLHVPELKRMGADIEVQGNSAIISGVACLNGSAVKATDLRAGAALTLAGLAADGTTSIHGLCHILRGYEDFERHLAGLGARVAVEEVQDTEGV